MILRESPLGPAVSPVSVGIAMQAPGATGSHVAIDSSYYLLLRVTVFPMNFRSRYELEAMWRLLELTGAMCGDRDPMPHSQRIHFQFANSLSSGYPATTPTT